MTHLDPDQIEQRLREGATPEPPADLVKRLKAQIPERPVVVSIGDRKPVEPSSGRRYWLVAATVAVAVIGGSLAYRVSFLESPASFVEESRRDQLKAPSAKSESPAEAPEANEPTLEDVKSKRVNIEDRSRGDAEIAEREEPAETIELSGEPRLSAPLATSVDTILAPQKTGTEKVGTKVAGTEGDAAESSRLERRSVADSAADRPADRDWEMGEQDLSIGAMVVPQVAELAEAAPPSPKRDALSSRDVDERPRSSKAPLLPARGHLRMQSLAQSAPSTGGTSEPNDQAYGDMFLKGYGVNPFIDTDDDNLSTFGLDVDSGSYTLARGYLNRGVLPPPEAIRVEEFVNFFDYPSADGRKKDDGGDFTSEGDFSIYIEGAPTPFGEGERYRLLRFTLEARQIAAADRRPATLVFVVDVSGSMDRDNRLGLVKRSLGLLLDQLRGDDHVGLVTYGDRGRVLLEPSNDHEAIRSAIGSLRPNGSTNAEEGLVLAYGLAERSFRDGAINRIVLCSDGVANVGRTGPDSILDRIGGGAERGIELTTVGFGMGNYNDVLMEQLADRGDGSYAYVDTLSEARRVFVENLTGTLQTVARDAKVQVEFNPQVVSRYRLLGYENRAIADERFRDDTVDAGEIGAGHTVTALYEIKLQERAKRSAEIATLRLRYHSVDAERVVESAASLRVRDLPGRWGDASAGFRMASLVAEFAEVLRNSYWAREGDLADVFTRAQQVVGEAPGNVDLAEFVALLGRASVLTAEPSNDLDDER